MIKRIVILSVTITGMNTLTGFFFDDETEDIKSTWTKEPKIGYYYSRNIKDKNVNFETINTLDFLENEINTSKKFFEILDKEYYNPISVDDTGIQIDGKIVGYGETVIIHNVQKIVEKFESLKESNLGKLNVDKIELEIYKDGPKIMGSIGMGKLINKNGKAITVIEDYYIKYAEKGESFEDFIKKHNIESAENIAYSINESITKRPHRKERIIEDYIKMYERDIKEESEPLSEMIGLNLLFSCIKENLVTLKK